MPDDAATGPRMVLVTGEDTTGDPFFDAFRAGQPAADIVLMPPEDTSETTMLEGEEAASRLQSAGAAVEQVAGALAALLDAPPPDPSFWRYGDSAGELVAEVRGTLSGVPSDQGPALLGRVRERLSDDAWSMRILEDGIPRCVGDRDGDGVLVAHVAEHAVIDWRCWSAPVRVGTDRAREIAEGEQH